jgi:integrase
VLRITRGVSASAFFIRFSKKLGIARGGFHAYRHGRVTSLRKNGTPAELQTQWIGHSSLRTTDGYDHMGEQSRGDIWWAVSDLNAGPSGCKPDALTAELTAHVLT